MTPVSTNSFITFVGSIAKPMRSASWASSSRSTRPSSVSSRSRSVRACLVGYCEKFVAAYAVTNFSQYPTKQARTLRLRELTLDGLVERELLAHEAERIGFAIDPTNVMNEFVETGVIYRNAPRS